LAEGQGSAALSGAVYKPARSTLSTPDVNKSSHRAENLESTANPDF
jgi:hypothetical protein